MDVFQAVLLLATFLCSLVAGLLFAFACVAMPGIAKLSDRGFIRAFQVIDGVIQNNQPLFMLVWVGSVVTLLVAAGLGLGQLDITGQLLLGSGTLSYIVGVQLPTAAINIPLNNRLQTLDPDALDDAAQQAARVAFELPWNRWNVIRSCFAGLTSALLLVLLFRL